MKESLKNLKVEFKISDSQLQKTIDAVKEMEPTREGQTFKVEDKEYTLIGKWWWAQTKYLFQDQNGQYASALITAPKINSPHGGSVSAIADLEPMKLDIVKLGDIAYNPDIFIPLESATPLDKVFSKKGGIMPATNYIVIGDPGIGKSSLSIEYAAQLRKNNPDKKILFVSGEMTRIDMYGYLERFKDWKNLPTVFLSEFTEGRYKESVESLFNQGWDCIVLDSFAEINEAVKEDYNMFMNGKMSTSGAEKWLIDLFIKNNLADNDEKKHTSFISIQQVTKGGAFVGSNKLKHNTTGMIELRYTKNGERKINVSKNRRGFEYQDLHFDFSENGDEPIVFDVARIEREKELQGKINAERDQILNDERKLNALFGIDTGEEELDEAIETAEVIAE